MLSRIKSATLLGINALEILVEVDAKQGLPAEHIVGLPDTVIRESRCRIRSAIKNSGFQYPVRHYIINLAPAEIPKEGAVFDLPIAVGILEVTGQIDERPEGFFVGELSLNGDIKSIRGIISICEMENVTVTEIGVTGGSELCFCDEIVAVEELREAHEHWLPDYMAAVS